MKKRLATLLLAFMCIIILTSCQQTKATKLTYKPFSDDEQYLLSLTDNKILMYDLKNLPTDNKYTLTLTYECFLLGIHTVRKVCGGYQPATAGF